jgi:hypothetical protein
MATMTTSILNNSYWNTVSPETLPDFDDLFSSSYTLIFNDEYNLRSKSIKEELVETPLSSEVKILTCYLSNVFFYSQLRLIKNNYKNLNYVN